MNKKILTDKNCFTLFDAQAETISLPVKFTFPFYYDPHPLCILAANQLQDHLKNRADWDHNFGLDNDDENSTGKMFGVLVVENDRKEIGFLSAYSGKIANRNDHPGFVPPIFDLLNEDGFYRKEENVISSINHKIEKLERDNNYLECKKIYHEETKFAETLLQQKRKDLKSAKNARKVQRESAEKKLTPGMFNVLKKKLKKESLDQQYEYKRLAKEWKERLEKNKEKLESYINEINSLKEERKNKSAALQKQIFEKFSFLNYKGISKSLYDIFLQTANKIPPAGAGECSAPKLLQYAYKNNMKPIAMAEFWWGKSPRLEIRKHGHYYPACRSKCEPILKHMLDGLDVEKNPMLENPAAGKDIEIIYEDEFLLVVNKPADFLSVPGKNIEDSVYTRIKEKYPEATGPLIAHRLDMSTSGLMVIAKTKDIHKNLQNQFLQRTVKKRYVALLDGILKDDEGTIDLPLRVDLENRPYQMVCYEYGKPALTKWKIVKRFENQSKVYFFPITGRTHQLRVHAAHPDGLNSPIAGDDLYNNRKGERLCLHAGYLKFIHPVTGKTIKFNVDEDF